VDYGGAIGLPPVPPKEGRFGVHQMNEKAPSPFSGEGGISNRPKAIWNDGRGFCYNRKFYMNFATQPAYFIEIKLL